jgi:hypothetical protein
MARIVIDPRGRENGKVRLSANLVSSSGPSETLWWEVPEERERWLTESSDPWAVAFIFPIMQLG